MRSFSAASGRRFSASRHHCSANRRGRQSVLTNWLRARLVGRPKIRKKGATAAVGRDTPRLIVIARRLIAMICGKLSRPEQRLPLAPYSILLPLGWPLGAEAGASPRSERTRQRLSQPSATNAGIGGGLRNSGEVLMMYAARPLCHELSRRSHQRLEKTFGQSGALKLNEPLRWRRADVSSYKAFAVSKRRAVCVPLA